MCYFKKSRFTFNQFAVVYTMLIFVSAIFLVCFSAGEEIVKAVAGQDVSLPCRADGDIHAVRWIRPDLGSEYVLSYRGRLETDHQHPSFQQRVDLQDRQMKDGNVSLILRKVMINDAGTYECRVSQRGSNTITSIVHLDVSPAGKNIKAEAGQDVSLPCRTGHDGDIQAVEWTRDDLVPDGVFMYRGGRIETEQQHPSFQQRVDLQDRQMKDGDVSLILKKVTTDDAGTYECRVFQRGRDLIISIIHLDVSLSGTSERGGDEDGGDEDGGNQEGSTRLHVGVIVSVLLAAVFGFVGLMFSRRKQKAEHHLPPEQSEHEMCESVAAVHRP